MPYEEYFKAAIEGLIIVDHAGQIVEVNPAVERLFGYSEQELKGQPVELLIPEQLREIHREHIADYFTTPRTRSMGRGLSLAGRRKDGSDFPVEISLTYAHRTSRGDLVVASIIDISQRLALEQEVRRAETLISMGTLAAGIAHDINNPLQVMRSRAELVLDFPDTACISEIREDVATILRQAQRASHIVEEFLELSRRNGRAAEPVDINEIVERALLLLGESMRTAGIAMEATLARHLPRIAGHPLALERVLINLLSNARDAMPQGGVVRIRTGYSDDVAGSLSLTVADEGAGIAPEALGKVFDLLYTTKSRGNGLGLWLSRQIIQEHRGKIAVWSELGKGTTFTISLPRAGSPDS
jgi:PAS domain S-box-containing protein